MARLRVAVVGLGRHTLDDHIPGILASRRAELVAVCDSDEMKVNEQRTLLGVPGYTDFRRMLDEQRVDFIVAATPHDTYPTIITEAAARHVHVLKEKPFARNLQEALAFKRIAEENSTHLMAAVQRRFNPIYTTFFQLREHIGAPYFVDAKYAFFVDNPHEGWRANRELAGGGCILDMGYHMVDMLIWYFGLPDNVHAEFSSKAKNCQSYDAEDTASVMFSYKQGAHGVLLLSRSYPEKVELVRILGDAGVIEIGRGSIRRLKSDGEQVECLKREVAWPAAASSQIDYFCGVIAGERDNEYGPEGHLAHVSFVDACYLSKQQGTYVNPKDLPHG